MQAKAHEAYMAARNMPASREALVSADADTALGQSRLAARLGNKVRAPYHAAN